MQHKITHLSSKCYPGEDMKSIDGVVIHYISAVNILPEDPFNLKAILGIFEQYKVSAHYLIDRDGVPIDLVPLPKIAYHAGRSRMNGRNGCNDWCIGIELMGGKDFPYTDEQIATLKLMLGKLMSEHRIPLENIEGHDYVRTAWNRTYPEKKGKKKYDPGTHFPWKDVRDSLQFIG